MNRQSARQIVGTTVIVAMTLTGCATTQSGEQAAAGGSAPNCNPLIGAGVGAAIGAIANKGKGALVGAAVGALGCMAINAMTRQTKPASQVEEDFRKSNKGALPAEPVVSAYNVVIQPTSAITAGHAVSITSNAEVVSGTRVPITEIREELALLDPTGKEQAKKVKVLTETSTGSGGYESQFNFKLPQGVPQGAYTIRTTLYVNGAPAKVNNAKMQMVFSPRLDHKIRVAAVW